MTDTERRDPRHFSETGRQESTAARSRTPAAFRDLLQERDTARPLPLKVVGVIGLAWIAAIAWLTTISPVLPENAPPPSGFDMIVQTAMLGSWLAVLAGIGTRRRFVFGASVAGGVILAGAAMLCLATGHTGLWIPAQIGAGVGLAGLGYGASRIT